MIATLARSGSSFTLNNKRCYDACGEVRNGATSDYPKNRYCGNLGHQQDDESGLIYMRARYYEPWSGRFISEDNGRQGANWFVYCRNCPPAGVDPTGKAIWAWTDLAAFVLGIFAQLVNAAEDGSAVLGISEIGGSTFVLSAALIACAVLTIVGTILTANALIGQWTDMMSGRQALVQAKAANLVTLLKGCSTTATLGWDLELVAAINEINCG